jgi:hypothetical protein
LRGDVATLQIAFANATDPVPIDRWTERPADGRNSLAWLLWHMARCQDLPVNVVLRGGPQVLDEGWIQRLGVEATTIGTGFGDEELAGFDGAIDVPALLAYWDKVCSTTDGWLRSITDDELVAVLAGKPDIDERLGAVGDTAAWVYDLWRGQEGSFFLRWVALGHGYWHAGEAASVAGALGYPGG